ncbi:MAG: IS66 family transposase [Deltaproteobacteria bacterium]|nr:IS66 family transposase [Deltaproteobacteria bacterium]
MSVEALEERLHVLETALVARDAQVAERDARIDALKTLVAELTEKLNQNSRNSHLPPSSDGPGAGGRLGTPRSGKSKSKKKRGGQKGHRGAHRLLAAPDAVDSIVDLFPDACGGCAAALPRTLDPEAYRYQQVDLQDHQPHVTEWRRHEVLCSRCGSSTRAAYDSSVIPCSAFGPRLVAVVVLLTGDYHLSRRKAQRMLRELFGIRMSLGAVSTMEGRATEALAPAYDEAKAEVEQALVKHADATSWLRSGRLRSLWTIATRTATFYRIFADGSSETIRPMFGACLGILVSDRATVFGFWAMKKRQICFAHLLRKFIGFSERDGPAGRFGRELLEYTALIFDDWHGFKEGLLTREELALWLAPVRRHFERSLTSASKSDIRALSGSAKDVLAHKEALWTFVTEDGVEPTNNHAERELRAFVLWRKQSFGSQSERGDRYAERIMTVARTARKQGQAVLEFVVRSIEAHLNGAAAPRLIGA